jgi:hypothetical protein
MKAKETHRVATRPANNPLHRTGLDQGRAVSIPSAICSRLGFCGAFYRQPVTDEGESQVGNHPIGQKGLHSPFLGVAALALATARRAKAVKGGAAVGAKRSGP